MPHPGSSTHYPKRKLSNATKGGAMERLGSRMLLATKVGPVDPLQRAMGDYALESRERDLVPSPDHNVQGVKNTTTESGLASRGNVIQTRYLKGGGLL